MTKICDDKVKAMISKVIVNSLLEHYIWNIKISIQVLILFLNGSVNVIKDLGENLMKNYIK